jgi:hypothetical protein
MALRTGRRLALAAELALVIEVRAARVLGSRRRGPRASSPALRAQALEQAFASRRAPGVALPGLARDYELEVAGCARSFL